MSNSIQRIQDVMRVISIKRWHRRWIFSRLSALIVVFVNIIFILRIYRYVDGLVVAKLNNRLLLSIVVLVSNKTLLEAAQDTWILECPFEVVFQILDNNDTQSNKNETNCVTVDRTRSYNRYILTVDVKCYVIVTRLQQLLTEKKLGIDESMTNKNKDCQSVRDDIFTGPLQTLRDFDRAHLRVTASSRRPIQNPKGYDSSIDPKCVHNPLMQLETYRSFYLPECPSPPTPRIPIELSHLHTYVISIKKNDSEQIRSVMETFQLHGLRPIFYEGFQNSGGLHTLNREATKLSTGEVNLRETMRQFLTQMINLKLDQILVFEDDVLPHKHFGSRLSNLITTPNPDRCAAHILNGLESGGILLLGATVWSIPPRGWETIDQDINNHSLGSTCFNIDQVTYGAFAVLMHRMTFQPILNWLNNHAYAHLPYDHVFQYLSRRGHIVRVAYPFLAIADVSHASSVNPHRPSIHENVSERVRIHRWSPLSDYFIITSNSSTNRSV